MKKLLTIMILFLYGIFACNNVIFSAGLIYDSISENDISISHDMDLSKLSGESIEDESIENMSMGGHDCCEDEESVSLKVCCESQSNNISRLDLELKNDLFGTDLDIFLVNSENLDYIKSPKNNGPPGEFQDNNLLKYADLVGIILMLN